MKKRIFIVDSFSLNVGDIAILIALYNLVKKKFPNSSVSIEVSHPDIIKKVYEVRNNKIFPRIIDIQYIYLRKGRYILLKTLFSNIYDSLSFLIWALMFNLFCLDAIWVIRSSRKAQAIEFKSADIIISTGGGFLSTYYKYGLRLYTLALAFMFKKKVVLLSQSIGPFNTTFARIIIPLFLNRVSFVSVREPSSYRYLKGMKIKTYLYETSDFAFLLPHRIRKIKNKKRVIMCIKNYKGQILKEYKKAIRIVTQSLLSKGYRIVFLSQTIDDDLLGKEMKDLFRNEVDFIKFTYDVRHIMNLYSECDFVISSRMHAVVFSILSGVPFISIGDEPKFLGLLEKIDYDNELSMSINNINIKKLLTSIDYLIQNQYKISKHLANKREILIKQAKENINILEDLNLI